MNANMNAYPEGRWTRRQASVRSRAKTQRMPLFVQPAAGILKAPLRDLFWGIPESQLLDEARQRVENVIAAALRGGPAGEPTAQQEFSPV
jgi:hypothetical protein